MLYENTSINQAKSDLLSVLKTFDAQKNVSVKEYREAFVKALNDETIIFGTANRVLVVNFYEKEEKQITFEIIQEIKDTNFYCLNENLNPLIYLFFQLLFYLVFFLI